MAAASGSAASAVANENELAGIDSGCEVNEDDDGLNVAGNENVGSGSDAIRASAPVTPKLKELVGSAFLVVASENGAGTAV